MDNIPPPPANLSDDGKVAWVFSRSARQQIQVTNN